jgi:hypothetical protein
MTVRRFCTAWILVAFIVALAPTPAAALPDRSELAELGRPWLAPLVSAFVWLRDSAAEALMSFVPAQGATITGNGGK